MGILNQYFKQIQQIIYTNAGKNVKSSQTNRDQDLRMTKDGPARVNKNERIIKALRKNQGFYQL